MLKPALARGELHCIGATTLDEYRKYVEKDAALERRFQKVLVAEPTVEATIAILRGLQEKYEVHHGVEITDPAIVARGRAEPSLHHRPLPAGQGDRPDRRGRRQVKIEIDSKPEVMDRLDRRIIQLKIEREAVRRETDESSQRRMGLIEEEIVRLGREYADLEEIWTAEKAAAQGSGAPQGRHRQDALPHGGVEAQGRLQRRRRAAVRQAARPGAPPGRGAGRRGGQVDGGRQQPAAAHAGRRRGDRRGPWHARPAFPWPS